MKTTLSCYMVFVKDSNEVGKENKEDLGFSNFLNEFHNVFTWMIFFGSYLPKEDKMIIHITFTR